MGPREVHNFAIQEQLGIPIKLVGIGERIEDLVPFDIDSFVEAIRNKAIE